MYLAEDFSIDVKELTSVDTALLMRFSTVAEETAQTKVYALTELQKEAIVREMCQTEHSPIRAWMWLVTFHHVPHFVMTHLTRHKVGAEFYVENSRKADRHEQRQDDPISFQMVANAQALINIARKRICAKAFPDTAIVTATMCKEIAESSKWGKILAEFLVPTCIRTGTCFENKSRGECHSMAIYQLNHPLYTEEAEDDWEDFGTPLPPPTFDPVDFAQEWEKAYKNIRATKKTE